MDIWYFHYREMYILSTLRSYLYLKRRARRLVPALILLIVVCFIVNDVILSEDLENTASSEGRRGKCPDVAAHKRLQLFQILNITNHILDKLKVSHFLCYKSLWGASLESGPFIWDPNAHLCAINSVGVAHDEPNLLRHFRRVGLDLRYSAADANYKVTNSSEDAEDSPNVLITMFEADARLGRGMYRRVGWKRRLLPPNCDAYSLLECFPSFLIAKPLPMRTFGPLTLPAPQSDIDLLKYHFPDTWYKPVPATC